MCLRTYAAAASGPGVSVLCSCAWSRPPPGATLIKPLWICSAACRRRRHATTVRVRRSCISMTKPGWTWLSPSHGHLGKPPVSRTALPRCPPRCRHSPLHPPRHHARRAVASPGRRGPGASCLPCLPRTETHRQRRTFSGPPVYTTAARPPRRTRVLRGAGGVGRRKPRADEAGERGGGGEAGDQVVQGAVRGGQGLQGIREGYNVSQGFLVPLPPTQGCRPSDFVRAQRACQRGRSEARGCQSVEMFGTLVG